MTWTDYAGLAGLAAAALLATWLFLGAGNSTPHRSTNPRHSTPASPQPPRHRRRRR